jgi:hypothetical protein
VADRRRIEIAAGVDPPSLVDEESESRPIGSVAAINLTRPLLGIGGESRWRAREWDEASRLQSLDPGLTARWPAQDGDSAILIQPNDERDEEILQQIREVTPEPEESQERPTAEVS